MYVVALQFEKGAGDALAVRLAAVLGRTLLEARGRVSEPEGGPAVLATFAGAAAANGYAEELRSRGFEVLVLSDEVVETEEGRFMVRSFELGPDVLVARSRQEGTVEVPWRDVRLLLRGMVRAEHRQVRTEERRKLSLGRAVLTGGLMVTKAVKVSKHENRVEKHGFLHLYTATGRPLVFRESELNYAGLGGVLHPTTAANFHRLATALRQASRHAVYDERLATQPGQARLLGPSLPPETYLDFAVSLLARALRGEQRAEAAGFG